MTQRGEIYQDFRQGDGPGQWSRRALQNVSDAARRSAEARVGSGMNSRGDSISQQIQPPAGLAHAIKIVAVVGKPNPAFHRLVVREIAYAFEGSDFVAPDEPTDPPTPVAPASAILRWKGDPFFALPGYTNSTADFASTWFSDILRDDAGEPIYVNDVTIEALPDDTVTLHWLYLRPQGLPVLVMMGGGGSDVDFVVVTRVIPMDPELTLHTSFTVWVRRIRRIPNWPPDPPDPPPENPPDPVTHGGWEFVGDAVEIATYPGVPAIYYEPFLWDSPRIVFPDIPILRAFTAQGETYLEQTMRWAVIEVGDGVRLSDCPIIDRRTEETL